MVFGRNNPAVQWMHRGADLLDSDLDEAERWYRKALELDRELSGAWFDLGLIHKWRTEWQDCLDCNRRAVTLNRSGPESEDPAYWNAGIAATALGDWETARWAWRGFGIPIGGEGGEEIEEDFGPGAVRLPDGEVVWGRRIDPARMRLMSVPLPESGFRSDDVVLHDGAPEGSRMLGDWEVPVFNVLKRLLPSPRPTIVLLIDASAAEIDALIDDIMSHEGHVAENWTESVAILCAACSYGRVDYEHPDHHHHQQPEPSGYTRLGCSGDPSVIDGVATAWQDRTAGVVQQTTVHQ